MLPRSFERIGVVEHDLGDTGPVEPTVGIDDVGTEALHHLVEHDRTGRLELLDDGVGVDETAPRSARAPDTVDFPDPIPPVSPINSTPRR